MKTILLYSLAWIGLAILAIINGTVREKGYGRFMNELTAHQLSTIIALGLFGIYIWRLTGTWEIESGGQAVVIGGIWLVLTVLFEFIFGHYMMGHRWKRLFQDYNLTKGRLWVLVLIWTAIAPYVIFRINS